LPLALVYAIGILLAGALALFAPHAHGLSMTLAEIYTFCMVVAGGFELYFGTRRE